MTENNRLWILMAAAALVALAGLCSPAQAKRASHASNSGMFVVYGDTRSDDAAHAEVVNYIVSLKPGFVLQTGDLVDNGDDPAQWAQYDQIEAPIRAAHIPDYPARGNHDIGPYYIKEVRQPFLSGNGYYYSFVRLGIRFIAVDSFSPYDPGTQQYAWIESQLKDATANHQTPVPFFHESPFSVGPHGDNFDAQHALHPLFVKYHVPLVFCGHDHLYYRTKRDGITYIVTGGGGAPLYVATNTQYSVPGDVWKTTHHVIECVVTPASIALTALEPDGTVIDTLTVRR